MINNTALFLYNNLDNKEYKQMPSDKFECSQIISHSKIQFLNNPSNNGTAIQVYNLNLQLEDV